MSAQPSAPRMTREDRIRAVIAVLARWHVRATVEQARDIASEIVDAAVPEAGWSPKPDIVDRPCVTCRRRPRDGDHLECRTCIRRKSAGRHPSAQPARPAPPTRDVPVETPPEPAPVARLDEVRRRHTTERPTTVQLLAAMRLADTDIAGLMLIVDDELDGIACETCGERLCAGDRAVARTRLSHVSCAEPEHP